MSKNYFVIIYCYMICCCDLYSRIPCYANSTSWSAVNLLIDARNDNRSTRSHATQSYGIIAKSANKNVTNFDVAAGNYWTKIEVTLPPTQRSALLRSKYHATLTNPLHLTKLSSPVASHVRSIQNEPNAQRSTQQSTQLPLTTTSGPGPSNRSSAEQLSFKNTPLKGVNGETGHAFFYDDDDDDDDDDDNDGDDDDYDDDDNYVQKKDENEDEDDEIVDDEKNVEETAETVDPEAQEEYENYAETRPPIILRTRRKNKRKRGKKHGSIKIKDFKKLRKFMLPLLLAYKLKFFTLVPLLLGGLVLIVATTGFAGFFFALFAVGLGLKHHH